jgi:hypothetical protein
VTSTVAAVRSRAVAVPAWLWLTGIVVASCAVRIALARRMVAPWIMVDELVYSELAKSLAEHGRFLVRGEPSTGYGFVYPALIAPAWRVHDSAPDAYALAKAINAVVMSLAAVPAYFLARRLLAPALSLAVAGLTVAVPSMLYTGMLMTENVFYPMFLAVALALVLTLERPTVMRQVILLALCGVAFAARAQAVALVPAAATAPILLALIERRGLRRGLRPFAPLYAILGGGALLALLATAARGRSPLTLLGAYRAATDSTYTVGGILRYLLYHVAELDLYLGVIPFAALLALWLAPRTAPAFVAASLPLTAWLVAEVAAFASQPSVDRIEERNMFYVAPFALVALVGFASDSVVLRRRRPLVVAAAAAGVLPFFIPYGRLIAPPAVSDTFALLPWWWLQDHVLHLDQVKWVVLAAAVAAAAVFVFLPRRFALVLPALVGAYFLATSFVVENGRHGLHKATLASLWAGIRVDHPDWIDRAVGGDAHVAAIWTGKLSVYSIWENEFFNRSLGTVYDLGAGQSPGGLPETAAVRRADGRVVADGRPVRSEYVLADGSVDLAGTRVRADPRIGLALYRVDGPLVVLTDVRGLYANDTWSGKRVTYTRVRCTGGRLSVLLASDPTLFPGLQTVLARTEGATRVARVPPSGRRRLTVPLQPNAQGVCLVRFDVARTAVPGPADRRELGAHFLRFDYRP